MFPKLDPGRLAVIRECMENYEVGDASAEWPNNIISRQAVVYDDGTIARRTDIISHAVNASELVLCRKLAEQAAQLMVDVPVGMGSESDDGFRGFFVAARAGNPRASTIDEAFIREVFGGTLFPLATITVEPFAENTIWWSEVLRDGEESHHDYFIPWREMSTWFQRQSAFVATAFVRIGDSSELMEIPEDVFPEGTVITGCVLPRLALDLTHNGSVAGLFGYSVQG